jgi:hypothetical protein|tara:strand:- start:1235 stop:1336 length:102 start_codon:yes stop_codon:yes gene_type:complete
MPGIEKAIIPNWSRMVIKAIIKTIKATNKPKAL